jgi:hypothetical protein
VCCPDLPPRRMMALVISLATFSPRTKSLKRASMPPVQPRGVLIHVDVDLLHPCVVGDALSRFGWTRSQLHRFPPPLLSLGI